MNIRTGLHITTMEMRREERVAFIFTFITLNMEHKRIYIKKYFKLL